MADYSLGASNKLNGWDSPAMSDAFSLVSGMTNYGVKLPAGSNYTYQPSPELYNYSLNPALLEPGYGAPTTMLGQLGISITDTLKSANKWMQDVGLIGGKDDKGNTFNGWGGLALGTAQGLGSIYMGMKQSELQKDSLNFQKDAFNKNYAAQKSQINSQLEDRQRARIASNSGAYQSVGDYMNQYGVR